MSFILACDIGGSRIKAALIDGDGRTVAMRANASPEPTGRDGVAEVEPEAWWGAFHHLAEALSRADNAAFARIEAISITAVTRTQVLIDRGGRLVRPAILWGDTRAAGLMDEVRGLAPANHPETAMLNAFHPLARLFWLARHEPDAMAAAVHVLEPKDYLNFRLTGQVASDRVSMARLGAAAEKQDGRTLFDALGLDPRLKPVLIPPGTMVGAVAGRQMGALARLQGKPVVMTGNDTWTAVLGLGALAPGLAYNISGTTEVFGLVVDHEARAEGLLTVDWGDGLTQIGGPSQTGADALQWLAAIARETPAPVGGAPEAGPDAPLLFLPFLQGERVPYWDADLRGAFLGLRRDHGPNDLRRAVMEGVALVNRVVLARAEAAAGMTAREIRLGGGGATTAWARIKADILGRTTTIGGDEPGLLGAATAAQVALGRHRTLQQAQEKMAAPTERYAPDPARTARGDALFALFEEAQATVAPLSRRLAGWGRSEASTPS